MGTSERTEIRRPGGLKSSFRTLMVLCPMIMLTNKMLRGNIWGVSTEHDIKLHTFFEPNVDKPKDTFGFVGDGDGPSELPPSGVVGARRR